MHNIDVYLISSKLNPLQRKNLKHLGLPLYAEYVWVYITSKNIYINNFKNNPNELSDLILEDAVKDKSKEVTYEEMYSILSDFIILHGKLL